MEAKDMNEMEPRIIEAAKRVFVRKGYEAATMSDVAAEVGIGRTALHIIIGRKRFCSTLFWAIAFFIVAEHRSGFG